MGISREQALECWTSDDLIGIGMEADAVRRQLHPENVVSYVLDRVICCTAPGLSERLAEAVDLGATGLVLRGTVSRGAVSQQTSHDLSWFERTLHTIRTSFPSLWLHGLSATSIVDLATQAGVSPHDALLRLQAAGLQSLSGADAGILATDNQASDSQADAVLSPIPRCSVADWLAVHRSAHGLGLPSTAAMLFGAGETHEHRIAHLEAIQQLQQETGGFVSFLPTAFQPAAAGVRGFEEATAVEYLKTLAICRMVLDSIPNIEADWPTQGVKVLQMALRFGANDAGPVMPTESLTTPDGTTEEDLRRIIRGAGLRPVQRDTLYRTQFLG